MLWKERAALDAFLDEVRRTKIAVSPFDRDLFLRLSGGVFDSRGTLVGVIGASIPATQLKAGDLETIRREVAASARHLSAAFIG